MLVENYKWAWRRLVVTWQSHVNRRIKMNSSILKHPNSSQPTKIYIHCFWYILNYISYTVPTPFSRHPDSERLFSPLLIVLIIIFQFNSNADGIWNFQRCSLIIIPRRRGTIFFFDLKKNKSVFFEKSFRKPSILSRAESWTFKKFWD